MAKLDEDFKKAWCDKLESDEYKQAHGTLYDGKGYCCLGVACLVLGAQFEESLDSNKPKSLVWRPLLDGVDLGDPNESVLSDEVLLKINMTSDSQGILWRMNDKDQLSFKEIASYIRAKL